MGYDIEDPDEVLETLTPKRLKKIAGALDFLSDIAAQSLRTADEVTIDGDALCVEDIDYMLEWVEGTEMQDDLRTWAKALKQVRKEAKACADEPSDEETAVELVRVAYANLSGFDPSNEGRSGTDPKDWLEDAQDFLFWYDLR